jgi:rRNA-processing protein FCF1
MREVVMDTNFLLLPYQFKIDIFTELDYLIDEPYQLVISSKVVDELQVLSKKVGKSGAGARFAIKLLEVNSKKIITIDSEMFVDDWIKEYTQGKRTIVCTNDAALKRSLKKNKLKVIGLRTKTKLGYI